MLNMCGIKPQFINTALNTTVYANKQFVIQ